MFPGGVKGNDASICVQLNVRRTMGEDDRIGWIDELVGRAERIGGMAG